MTKQKNYALKSSAKYIFLCERPMKSSVWRDIFGVSVIMYIPNMFHPERSMNGFYRRNANSLWENDAFEESEEELSRLRREIAFLKEKRRQIVYRFYYEDKSISVIAKEMEIPEGTVKWHLNKAKIELKEGLLMERKIGKLGLSPMKRQASDTADRPGGTAGRNFI